MKKKIITLLLITTMVFGTLSGCGKQENSGGGTDAAAEKQTNVSDEARKNSRAKERKATKQVMEIYHLLYTVDSRMRLEHITKIWEIILLYRKLKR